MPLRSRRLLAVLVVSTAACGEVPAGTMTPDPSGPDAGEPSQPDLGTGPDAAPVPTGPEACTSTASGASPVDEDADGAIDEGCTWHAGNLHLMPVHAAGPATARYDASWISRDGLRLYASYQPGATIVVASRPSPDQPFQSQTSLRGVDLADWQVWGATFSADEREAFVSAWKGEHFGGADIYRMVRAPGSETWSALERVDVVSSADQGELRPFLSVDGTELYFTRGRSIYRAVRSSPASPFRAPEQIDITAGDAIPDNDAPYAGRPKRPIGITSASYLSDDGRVLVYLDEPGDGPSRLYRAERAAPGSTTFEHAQPLGLDPSERLRFSWPVISQSTREIFTSIDVETAPESPFDHALWRAELCLDGPCPERKVDCPPEGIRSSDGMHCYTRQDVARTQADAAAECAALAPGAHLVTISGAGENELVRTVAYASDPHFKALLRRAWIGASDTAGDCTREASGSLLCSFGWVTGEPSTYGNWRETASVKEPDHVGTSCTSLEWFYGFWSDGPCTDQAPAVCEIDLYPTW